MLSGGPRRASTLRKVLVIAALTLVWLGVAELVARIFYRGSPAVLIRDPMRGAINLEWSDFFRKHRQAKGDHADPS